MFLWWECLKSGWRGIYWSRNRIYSFDTFFWSLKEKDVVEEIKKQCKIQLTKKHIRFENGHIKQIGDHTIYVDFGDKITAKVNITIF